MKPNPVTLKEFLQWRDEKRKITLILEDVMARGTDQELQAYLQQCVAEQKDEGKTHAR